MRQPNRIFQEACRSEASRYGTEVRKCMDALLSFTESELDGTLSDMDVAKERFMGMVSEPKLEVQPDVASVSGPYETTLKQFVDKNELNPFEKNEVLCRFWDENIKMESAYSKSYVGKCKKFLTEFVKDHPEKQVEINQTIKAMESAMDYEKSFDVNNFPKTVFSESEGLSDTDTIQKKENDESFEKINQYMEKTLNEENMDSYNKVIFYIPFVENFDGKVNNLLRSDLCQTKNEVAASLAVATYESAMNGIIHPINAEVILHNLGNVSVNEFSVGSMMPIMGSTEGWGTILSKTPIEKVVKKTNDEVEDEKLENQIMNEFADSVLDFTLYVNDLFTEGVIDDNISPYFSQAFFEGFFGPKDVRENYTLRELKEQRERLKKLLEKETARTKDYAAQEEKIINDAYAYKDAFNKLPLTGKAKELYNHMYKKIKGQAGNEHLSEEKIKKLALEECRKAYNESFKKHNMSKFSDYDNGPSCFMSRKSGMEHGKTKDGHVRTLKDWISDLDYSIELKERELFEDKFAAMKDKERTEAKYGKQDQKKEDEKKEEPKKPESKKPEQKKEPGKKSSGSKIIDIDEYRKTHKKPMNESVEVPASMMEFVSEARQKYAKGTLYYMGYTLLESGVEPYSLAMNIFESFSGIDTNQMTYAYLEATEEKQNGIFEIESRRLYDKIFRFTGIEPGMKDKEFERRISPDKSHITIYIKDKSKEAEDAIRDALTSSGFKKTHDARVKQVKYHKKIKSYLLEAWYIPDKGRLMLSYEKEEEVKESVMTEAADIDEDMKKPIRMLEDKGYMVKYSCAGHPHTRIHADRNKDGVRNGKLYTTARLTFEKKYDFKKAPDHWILSEKDNHSAIYVKPYTYGEHQGTEDEAWEKWKEMYMLTLLDWIRELPNISSKN